MRVVGMKKDALNSPAKSWRRASRSSATIWEFCAVNQSCNSSSVSIEESTGTGISTVSFAIRAVYQPALLKATAPLAMRVPKWSRDAPSSRMRGTWALAALIQGFGGAETIAFAAQFAFRGGGARALLAGTRLGLGQFLAAAGGS